MRRLSLRTRLVLGLLVLAAAGLVVADVATYKSQESFLFQQTDDNLQNEHQFAEQGRGPNGPGGPGLPPGVYIEGRSIADGRLLFQSQGAFPGEEAVSPPRLPKTIHLEPPSEGQPDRVRYFTANASSGDDRYRVRASIERGNPGVLLIVATLPARRRRDAAPAVPDRAVRDARGARGARPARALGRAHRPSSAPRDRADRGRDRSRRPLTPRRARRAEHRDRPPRARAERDARADRDRLPGTRGVRGQAPPLRRRRLARAAHAARRRPRLRRAVPARCSRAGRTTSSAR